MSTSNGDQNFSWHEVASRNQLDPDFPVGVEIDGQKLGPFLLGGKVQVQMPVFLVQA